MPTRKRARIQAYLEPELAEIIRRRAEEEDRPESREVTRLVQLGLEADAKCYALGGRVFRTKADIQAHVRAVREATPLGEPVTDAAVLALLRLHPDWEDKTAGGGVVSTALITHPAKARPTKEIAILHEDGRVVDISWTKLLPFLNKGSVAPLQQWDDRLSELRLAARYEVERQIAPLRKPGHEVDHVYPCTFDQLLYDWLISDNLVVDDVVIGSSTADTSRFFAAPKQAASWQAFHREYAHLQVVPKDVHAQRTQRAVIDWTTLL